MGQKIKTRFIQNLILSGILAALFVNLGSAAPSRRPASPLLSVVADYKLSPIQLTTDRIGILDSKVKNPHRRKWIVVRNTSLEEITVERPKRGGPQNEYGIQSAVLRLGLEGHVRGLGPWYLTAGEEELAKQDAATGADLWVQLLKENQPRLEVLLRRVKAGSEGLARAMALRDFQDWKDQLDLRWRKETGVDFKAAWGNSQFEPVLGKLDPSLLARAPARLWDRYFSVRASVKIGDNRLSGRFLLDPHLTQSVISPYWMENQGFSNLWAIIPNVPPVSVSDAALWKGKSRLGRPAWIESVEVSGMKLEVHEFLLLESELFSPPSFAISCCDGVLGSDFLSLYPIEFDRRAPAEVRIWSKPLFFQTKTKSGQVGPKDRLSDLMEWKEISQAEDGTILGLPDLGELEHFTLDLPHGRFWYQPSEELRISAVNDRTLGSLKPKNLAPLVETNYYMDHGDRRLRVGRLSADLKAKTALAELIAKGFSAGLELTQIDGVPVDELDQWQVNELLSRRASKKTLLVEWKNKKGKLESATLKLADL